MSTEAGHLWLAKALRLPPGAAPFPWQCRLLRDLVEGRLPAALDLPTGLGKTSVMAIWLVARALHAPVPRRLVYVVDRRAVVDQATSVAEDLLAFVRETPDVADALGARTGLPISTLRGQHVDIRAWLENPAAAAIVIGTVDMVGSRLMFSGYGVSPRMRPYHAGLLGADAWLVLDEAHLVPPFERLLSRIASGQDANGATLAPVETVSRATVPRLRVLTLSATGRQSNGAGAFALDADDRGHPVVRQRLEASKRIRLYGEVEAKALPEALATHAWQLCAEGRKPGRILIFVSSRDHAQKVQQALRKAAGKASAVAIELFVGGRRMYERERAAQRLQALGFVAGSDAAPAGPAFVVATSAGEVGVDLDADHAVCDLVAWERMVQRLGRVNRRGAGDATVVIVPVLTDDERAVARQKATLGLLARLPRTADAALDGSPSALSALKSSEAAASEIAQASTPAPLHPPLTRALVEAWAMTSMPRHTGRPEVAPWLRGWPDEAEPPQVCLIWRRHLPIDDEGRALDDAALEAFLDAAGPHLAERLEVDMPQALDWLLKRTKVLVDGSPAAPENDVAAPLLRPGDVMAVVLADGSARPRLLTAMAIAQASRRELEDWVSGTSVLLDRRVGGLTDGLLDSGAEAPAIDVTEAGDEHRPGPVPFRIMRVDAPSIAPLGDGWRLEAGLPLQRHEDGVSSWLVISSRVDQQAESEEGRSSAQRAQTLEEHQSWAEAEARALAQAMNLPPELAEMLAVAAALHDDGKRAARWQQAFHAPDRGRPPYAKTVGRPDMALLGGYRHEFGSLLYAESHPRLLALVPDLRELCLHLIAAHHGAARPLIRTDAADEPPSRAVVRARSVALRYAALSARWGPWGLAWWEALLRAADQRASRRNDEEGRRHG